MGNSPRMAPRVTENGGAPIQHFYSDRAWIEGASVEQLNHVANLDGMLRVAAMPDLHPGKHGPVGAAMLADRLYPQLIGNDIGCGMSLFRTDLPVRKIRIEKAARKLDAIETPFDGELECLRRTYDIPQTEFDIGFGTIGGGNHFLELQAVETAITAKPGSELDRDAAYLLVHSGSRALGHAVLRRTLAGHEAGTLMLDPESPAGRDYLEAHDHAHRWASLNRRLIAEKAARALRAELVLVANISHNAIAVSSEGLLHRKGAADADNPLVPIPGSRATLSFVVRPTLQDPGALGSLAHGAGRKYDRASMHGRAGKTKSDREALSRNPFGGLVVCNDRQLLIEEAGTAYKRAEEVVADLEDFGLAERVAAFRPLVTFKKGGSAPRPAKKQHRAKRRADR